LPAIEFWIIQNAFFILALYKNVKVYLYTYVGIGGGGGGRMGYEGKIKKKISSRKDLSKLGKKVKNGF
jgi:hypothetical protein